MSPTLYVDYLNGVDTNDGSSGSPLKTLAHTLSSHAANGDTILLRGGSAADEIYRETGISTSKTTLTIANDTGHQPQIWGSTAYSSWSLTAGQSFTYETAYTPTTCYMVWNGDTYFTSVASIVLVEAGENTFFFDNANDLLYVHVAGGGPPGTVEVNCPSVGLSFSGTTPTLRGIVLRHHLNGVRVQNNSATIEDCTIHYCYHPSGGIATVGVWLDTGTGHLIQDCTIYNYRGAGVKVDATGTGSIVRGCIISTTVLTSAASYGVYVDGATGVLVEHCTLGPLGDGVDLNTAGSTATIRYNTAVNCTHGGYRVNGAASYVLAHNNVVYVTDDFADGWHGFILDPGATGDFYHNVAHLPTYVGSNGYLVQVDTATSAFKNNIAIGCEDGFRIEVGFTPTLDADYNAAYDCGTNYAGGFPAGTYGVTTDPRCIDYDRHDFRLRHGSPCIDAGVLVTGVNEGFRGGAPDIGACEYVRPIVHRRR